MNNKKKSDCTSLGCKKEKQPSLFGIDDIYSPLFRDMFFEPLEEKFELFYNDFFNDFFSGGTSNFKKNSGYPKMNVSVENTKEFRDGEGLFQEREYVVRLSVPGTTEKDIKIEIFSNEQRNHETNLTVVTKYCKISGKMHQEFKSPDDSQVFIRELKQSQFIRNWAIPNETKGDPSAVLKNGILTLRWKMDPILINDMPKTKEIKIENHTEASYGQKSCFDSIPKMGKSSWPVAPTGYKLGSNYGTEYKMDDMKAYAKQQPLGGLEARNDYLPGDENLIKDQKLGQDLMKSIKNVDFKKCSDQEIEKFLSNSLSSFDFEWFQNLPEATKKVFFSIARQEISFD